MSKTPNKNKSTFILSIFRWLLVGLCILNGGVSLFLFLGAKMVDGVTIESFWASWLLSGIILCGLPLTLVVDGFVGSLYERWGSLQTKRFFLFVAKTTEALLVVLIVHYADEWIKGVSSSMWFEVVIGYVFFLIMEGAFSIGKQLGKQKQRVK